LRKPGGSPTGPPPYEPFARPRAVARLLEGLAVPWFVAGGWAIDLFLARETRTHEDIEVAILRKDQEVVRRHLRGWTFTKVATGSEEPWRENEWLNHPPTKSTRGLGILPRISRFSSTNRTAISGSFGGTPA